MAVGAGTVTDARGDQEDRPGARDRVLLRAVRRPVRPAEREARSGREPRRPCRATAPASPASPRARSARCRAIRTSPRSPICDSFTPVPWQPNLARFACDVTVEGEDVALLPAHDPPPAARARAAELGYEFKIGLELEYFLVQPQRRRLDRDRRRSRHAREALLRHGRPDAPIRLPDDRLEVLQRARLGQLRERPRGRERPVRAELHRTPTRSTSCDRAIFFRYMVHTLAEQHGMIATFMPKPFTHLTGNGCHFHMSLWRDGENLFLDEADPRGLGLSELAYRFIGGLKTHARAYSARDRADRELVQAPEARARRRAARPGRRSGSRTATTTARRCCGSRRPGGSRTARSTARRTRTSRPRPCSPPGSTGSRSELDPGEPNSENLYASVVRRADGAGSARRCPRTCSRRSASSSRTTSSARRSAAAAARTTSTTTRA